MKQQSPAFAIERRALFHYFGNTVIAPAVPWPG